MNAIIVSGSTGLLGGAVRKLLEEEYSESQILYLVRTPKKHNEIKFELPHELPDLSQLPKKFIFIHLANCLRSKNSEDFEKINVEGGLKLLQHFGTRVEKLLWSSSLSVLGQGPFEGAIESLTYAPQTPLAISRMKQEIEFINFCKKQEIKYYCLRGRLYIGKDEKEFNKYLSLLLKKPFLAFNKGQSKISVISSQDFAKVVLNLVQADGHKEGIYNIAYNTPLEIKKYLKANQIKIWTSLNSSILIFISKFLPNSIASSLQTKIELLGQNQVMSVEKLSKSLDNDTLDKDPLEIINSYIR